MPLAERALVIVRPEDQVGHLRGRTIALGERAAR
jgi:hypothetical protein